jgi:predicted permease
MKLKQALRALMKAPSVTITATLSLALGIGATAAIYSLFDQMILRSLPVKDPGTLVNLVAPGPKPGGNSCNQAGDCDNVFSYPMFRDLEREQSVFTGVAAHRSFGANLAYQGQTLIGDAMLVSGSYFQVLGMRPALGRLIDPGDDEKLGESPVVVLSHDFWRLRFNESPAVLNEKLMVNGQPLTIVGVAAEGFAGTTLGIKPLVFVPITLRGQMNPGFAQFENRRNYWAYLFARLKQGVSTAQAQTALNVPYHNIINEVEVPLQANMSEQTMQRFKARQILVQEGARGQSNIQKEAKQPLLLLLAVTGFVLLIACANVANLLLARSAARAGEIAVRLSIGASRFQLIRQLMTEALLLAGLGGFFGVVVSRLTLSFIQALMPPDVASDMQFVIDGRAKFFAAGLTIATGFIFGLFPALHSTRPDLLGILKGVTGQPAGARSASRFRYSLATVQIALSMMLLIAAGLFTKSLYNVSHVDLGMKVDNIVTFGISPSLSGYKAPQSRTLFERVAAELSAMPGVTAVSAGMVPLLAGDNWGDGVSVQGFEAGPDTDVGSRYNYISPGYFRLLGVPLISGREFTANDTLGTPKVAIVNEQFAKKFNLGREAVGKRMRLNRPGPNKELDIEIVGLITNLKYSEVKQDFPPVFYLPHLQNADIGFLTFYVRTSLDTEQLLKTITPAIARLDPNLPVGSLRTLPQQVRENVFQDRVISILSASFAGLATILAAIGLYGVLAYTVSQRTREFGLRMALGAQPGLVRYMILKQVGIMTLIGGTVGLAAGLGLGRLSKSMLFEVQGYDTNVTVIAAILLAVVAIGAGSIPAYRASNVDPMKALRYE